MTFKSLKILHWRNQRTAKQSKYLKTHPHRDSNPDLGPSLVRLYPIELWGWCDPCYGGFMHNTNLVSILV